MNAFAASTALSVVRAAFISALTPPGIGNNSAAPSNTEPNESTTIPPTFPDFILSVRLSNPNSKLAESHADSIHFPFASIYFAGFPA